MKNSDNQNKQNYHPYNGNPPADGEVLVPMLINRDYADLIEAQGVRTWYKCGIPFQVMFVPVAEEKAELAQKAFHADLNGYLAEQIGPNRHARCLVPQEDGSVKPCPREINGKRNICTKCPQRGKLEKEDRSLVSLETLTEENFHPMKTEPSAENEALVNTILDDLLKLASKFLYHEDIIRMGIDGLDRKQIIERLPVKKSQRYQIYNDCKRVVEEYLKND